MKKHLTFLIALLSLNLTFAQSEIDLTIAGFSPAVEKAIIAGDRVSYFTFDTDGTSTNLIVKMKTSKGTKRLFGSFDIIADADGHYDFKAILKIKEGSKISFDSDIEMLISMPTIFGNAVWTKITRTKENLADPIILDQYTQKAGEDYEATKRLNVNISAIMYDDELKAQVKAEGDTWRETKREDFRVLLKNKGDQEWKIDQIVKSGSKTGEQVSALLPYAGELDLEKEIIMRFEVKTAKGNTLWNEVSFEARGMTQVYFGTHYLISGDESAPDADDTDNSTEEDSTDDSTNDSSSEDTNSNSDANNKPVVNGTATTSNTNPPKVEDKPQSSAAPIVDKGAAIDLTTATIAATCGTMNAGDSLVKINGSAVCIRGFKPQGAKAMAGVLALDCNFNIGGTVFPIKGGTAIKCNKADGTLVEGELRANTAFNSSAGTIILKEGTLVKFQKEQLIGATLAENAALSVNGKTINATSNSSVDFDIRFDVKGRLVEFTGGDEVAWSANDLTLNFPAQSRMVFKNGELYKVYSPKTSSFDFQGATLNVASGGKAATYEFNSGKQLIEIQSGAGNSINLQEQAIPVQEGTAIKFEAAGGTTQISKFLAGADVTINVSKGKSTKETKVKAGKKIVLKEGTVVKAG